MESSEFLKIVGQLTTFLRNGATGGEEASRMVRAADMVAAVSRKFVETSTEAIAEELEGLSNDARAAQADVHSALPPEITEVHIPEAGEELDAVVGATEAASNKIMDAAEALMGLDVAEGSQETLQAKCMEIIEACEFQDITGQRLTKVGQALDLISTRLANLGSSLASAGAKAGEDLESAGDEALMNGPALPGEGLDQSAVDQLFAN